MKIFKTTFSLLLLLALSSCRNSSSSSEGGSGDPATGNPGTRTFYSDCGVLTNGSVKNPVKEENGWTVTIKSVVSPNTVIVSRSDGEQLIKLAGVSDNQNGYAQIKGKQILGASLGSAILYYADETCQVRTSGGGTGTLGTLIRGSDGVNLNELLIAEANAIADTGGACGTLQIQQCYAALDETTTLETGGVVSNFLWKPRGEHTGQLVVLLSPFAPTVIVNGEQLIYTGASNGRATTARGSKPGCSYGTAKVEAFDSQGRPLVFPNGELSYTIPNGCERIEF